MGLPIGLSLPENWRDLRTVDERVLENRLSLWGSDCINKVGRMWDSGVPGMPLFKTKKAAHDALETFVCDAIPLRCWERAASSSEPSRIA